MAWAMACGSAAVQAAPVAKPAASPAATAAAALLKEYQTVMKDKKGEGLREKCDYFLSNKPEGLTAEMIVTALEKPVAGGDARAEAYVKWQLLSGIEGKFPDDLKARAIKVYMSAPAPFKHPGSDHAGLQKTLNRIGVNKADAEIPINKDMTEAIEKYRISIEPILAYRDELYARLPGGFDTHRAALADMYARITNGAPTTEFSKTVIAAIRAWALASSEGNNMKQLGVMLDELSKVVKDDRNKPYYRVMWIKEDKYTGLRWQGEGTIQNDKYVGELGTWLGEHAKNPSGGLGYKDKEDPKMKK
jgi:hypothetical protein